MSNLFMLKFKGNVIKYVLNSTTLLNDEVTKQKQKSLELYCHKRRV